MKLDIQKIKEISVGAVDIWQDSDGVHFAKCTKEQLAVWKNLSSFLFDNANSTTGVRLDFHTDSTFVKVEQMDTGKYEVIIDGILTHQFKNADNSRLNFKIDLGRPHEMKHVVIILPSHQKGGIRSIEIDDGAKIERHKFDKKLLFLGDSITQGWNSEFDSMSYAYQVSTFLNAESVIQGIGGACFEPATVLPIGFAPEIVFVAYGTNDFNCRRSLAEIKDKAEEFLKKVKALYKNSKIFVISPIWRTDYDVPNAVGKFEDCCILIKSIARELGLDLVDGDKLIPPQNSMMADALHPNDLGFSKYALNLLRLIKSQI